MMLGLSQYKLLFMTEIIVAEMLFTVRLPRRKNFGWRVFAAIAACYLVAFLYPVGGKITVAGNCGGFCCVTKNQCVCAFFVAVVGSFNTYFRCFIVYNATCRAVGW